MARRSRRTWTWTGTSRPATAATDSSAPCPSSAFESASVWGVPTPSVSAPPLVRAADARGSSPTSRGPAGAEAARAHERAIEVLLQIASRELHLARLGEEIQETSRLRRKRAR